MIYTRHNLKYCMASIGELFFQWRDEQAGEGFRPISLSLAGPASEPIYSAVMVKYDPPFRSRSFHGITKDQLRATIDEMAALERPLFPYLIAATGSGSNVTYGASFREMAVKPFTKLNMFPNAFRDECTAQREAGRIPLWIDSFGAPDDVRYCAVWGANPGPIAWNLDAVNDVNPHFQERFNAMGSIGARSELLAMTPSGGIAQMFVDSRLKHGWSSEADMSGDRFGKALDEQKTAGFFPIRIATNVANNAVRYSAVFAKSDEILPRVFRVRGPEPIGLNAANRTKAAKIDEWMETYVRAHNFRGAAVAVVEGTRLVYAKGYTFAEAEPHYADIEPTTLFRMASVSKTFTALAVWKALSETDWSRNSAMQDILKLRKTDGTAPGGDFGAITVRHLLESNSGVNQGTVRDNTVYPTAEDPNGATQPLTMDDIRHAIADAPMTGAPGAQRANGKQDTKYGRTDYILLGLVAAAIAGRSSFTSALRHWLLEPLGMTRTRGSRSRIEDRSSDEAIQHSPTLETRVSAVHDDRRLIPIAYGYDNYEVYGGAGGLSSAVVDVARLGAMLNCRLGNPLFSMSVLDDLISDAVAATTNGGTHDGAHGWHGFDSATDDAGTVTLGKGGGLSAVGAGMWGKTGVRFIAIARNGEKVEGAPEAWNTEIFDLADKVDWGSGDLFPHFGMPTIGFQASGPVPVQPAGPILRPK
ncbi:MAG TPA: serine hydrolase [Allosphingosinicella sp.]